MITGKTTKNIAGNTTEIYVVEHAPCPKFRILMPLLESWRADEYESKAKAHDAWRCFVRGLAAELGLQVDEACVDPTRLFYFPRTRPGGPPYEFRRIHGSPVDLHAVVGVGASARRKAQEPPPDWLLPWAATHAPRFEILPAAFVRASVSATGHLRPDSEVGCGGGGLIGPGYFSAIHAKLAAVSAWFAVASECLARIASSKTSVAGPAAVA
jgi:hypothetical protein